MLEGITRQTVLDLAENTEATSEMFDPDKFKTADEIFITSTEGGVIPVTTIDNQPVENGKPGKIAMLLRRRYRETYDENRWTTAVGYSWQVHMPVDHKKSKPRST